MHLQAGIEQILNRYENTRGTGTEWMLNGNGMELLNGIPSPYHEAQISGEVFVECCTYMLQLVSTF